MEFYIGLVIGLIFFKIIVIAVVCYFRSKRRNTVIVVERRTAPRPCTNDGVAIINQAQPMGTSPPPYAPKY